MNIKKTLLTPFPPSLKPMKGLEGFLPTYKNTRHLKTKTIDIPGFDTLASCAKFNGTRGA